MSIANFVRSGKPVFPCFEDKSPRCKWKDENNWITDPNQITDRFLWGWVVPEGIIVVDIDNWDKWPYDPPQPTAGQRTPRGNHFAYIDPDPTGPAQLFFDWGEMRRVGTYMIIYAPNDEWIRDEYEKLPPEYLGKQSPDGSQSALTMSVPVDLTTLPQVGNRNNWLTAKAGELYNAHGINAVPEIYRLAAQIGLTEREAYNLVQQLPKWERTPPEDEYEPAEDVSEDIWECKTSEELIAHKPVNIDEYWNKRWLYGPGQSMMVYGHPGAGKSVFVMQMVYGSPPFHDTKVAYIDHEMTWDLIQTRVIGGPDKVIDSRRVNQNITFIKPSEHMKTNEWLYYDYSKWDTIVFDTKKALYNDPKYDENSSEHWAKIRGFCDKWKKQGKCIIFIHHASKEGDARGSSEAKAIFDVNISVNHKIEHGTGRTPDKVCYGYALARIEKARVAHIQEIEELRFFDKGQALPVVQLVPVV